MVEEPEPKEVSIKVDSERCIGCLECIDVCPQSGDREFPVYLAGPDGVPEVANPDNCITCLSCEVNCRAMAIRVEEETEARGSYIPREARAENKNSAMF